MHTSRKDGIIKVRGGGYEGQLRKYVKTTIDGDVLWCCRFLHTDKEAVVKSHLDYLRAGANFAVTQTYQACTNLFMEHLGLTEKESFDLIKESVSLAKKACDLYTKERPQAEKPQVVGSVGPYGAMLHDGSEYTGSYAKKVTGAVLRQWHLPRIKALVEGGVDLLAVETIPCRFEAETVILLLKEEFPTTKFWLSFSVAQDGHSISNGDDFQETAKYCYDLSPNQIVAVGVNCLAPRLVEPLLSGINEKRKDNPIPLIIYPNSGENYDAATGWTGGEHRPLETYVQKWLDMGVTWIGSCCRTDASDIEKICAEIEKWENKS